MMSSNTYGVNGSNNANKGQVLPSDSSSDDDDNNNNGKDHIDCENDKANVSDAQVQSSVNTAKCSI